MRIETTRRRWARPGARAAMTALALLTTLCATGAMAAPTTLLFEGFLRSAAGGPAPDGNYPVSFALFEGEKAAVDFWQEGPVTIAVKGGQLSHVLGSTKPLDAIMVAGKGQAWLQIKVGNDPALPRQKLHPVAYSVFAGLAGGVACSNCIPTSALKFSDTFDIGGNSFKAGLVTAQKVQASTVTAQSVVAGTVSAQKYVGDGSGLTGVGIKAGACPAGKVVSGVDQSGNFVCVSTAGSLPPDGLKFVSNGVMTTNFTDVATSPKVPVGIPDNNPVGVADTIDVPDLGTAEKLSITLELTNSKLDTIEVNIYDPANEKYVIWNKNKAGTKLVGTYPTVDKPVSGDLTKWWGKNPKGKWRIHVIDHAFKDNGIDGYIQKWTVNLATNSNKKVQINGDVIVTGKVIQQGQLPTPVLFPEGSRPFLYGYIEDKLNQQYWLMPHYTYAYNVPVTNEGLHEAAPQVVWGGKTGNIRFQRGGPNYGSSSSDRSQQVLVTFVKNTTKAAISHKVNLYYSCNSSSSNYAGLALNGTAVWNDKSTNATSYSTNLTFPAGQTSVVVLKTGSRYYTSYGSTYFFRSIIGYYGDSWKLPAGLEIDYDRFQQWIENK